MWYEKLLLHLISKVKLSEQKKAGEFLKILLVQIKCITLPEASIPPPILLGLIDKMYNKYGAANANSIELVEFARDLFSLSIIHIKKCYDEDVYLDDYPLINNNDAMLEILGYKNHPWNSLRKELYKLEFKTLSELDFLLEPDLNHFFNILCHQSQNDFLLVEDFILYSFPFAQKNDYYDQFLDQVILCYGHAMQRIINENSYNDVVPSAVYPQETLPTSKELTSVSMFQFKVMSPIAFFESNKTNHHASKFVEKEHMFQLM